MPPLQRYVVAFHKPERIAGPREPNDPRAGAEPFGHFAGHRPPMQAGFHTVREHKSLIRPIR